MSADKNPAQIRTDKIQHRLAQIRQCIKQGMAVKEKLLETQTENITRAADAIIASLKKGGKLLICGNGGSAADAQHIAGELVGRFKKERRALPAIALTANTSILTAIANDYGYEAVFRRQVEALAKKGDVLLAISTSGNSKNVLEAVKSANKAGVKTIGLTGAGGGKLARLAGLSITAQSCSTPRIQESHAAIYHLLCELIEDAFA